MCGLFSERADSMEYWYAIDAFNENGVTAGTVCKM